MSDRRTCRTSNHRKQSLPFLAPMRHADGHRRCLFIGVVRKSSVEAQNDEIDPERTFAFCTRIRFVFQAGEAISTCDPSKVWRDRLDRADCL